MLQASSGRPYAPPLYMHALARNHARFPKLVPAGARTHLPGVGRDLVGASRRGSSWDRSRALAELFGRLAAVVGQLGQFALTHSRQCGERDDARCAGPGELQSGLGGVHRKGPGDTAPPVRALYQSSHPSPPFGQADPSHCLFQVPRRVGSQV